MNILGEVTHDQKCLIAQWIYAWSVDDETAKEWFDRRLKATGLWVREAESGLPKISHWYDGAIQEGMTFIWNPGGTRTEEKASVTRFSCENGAPIVWYRFGNRGTVFASPESYFRAMVVDG